MGKSINSWKEPSLSESIYKYYFREKKLKLNSESTELEKINLKIESVINYVKENLENITLDDFNDSILIRDELLKTRKKIKDELEKEKSIKEALVIIRKRNSETEETPTKNKNFLWKMLDKIA